jgi:hypothetical protein
LDCDIDCVVWSDADVLFSCKNDFRKEVLAALSLNPVIQPWSKAEWCGEDGKISTWPSGQRYTESMAKANHGRMSNYLTLPHQAHPGLAWAMRREAFNSINGLFDKSPLGGGDTMMATAFWGNWTSQYLRQHSDQLLEAIKQWGFVASDVISGNVGFVDAVATHLWHGSRQSRMYQERHTRLKEICHNPLDYVIEKENGTFAWSDSTPHSVLELADNFFSGRAKDVILRTAQG